MFQDKYRFVIMQGNEIKNAWVFETRQEVIKFLTDPRRGLSKEAVEEALKKAGM